MEHRHKITLERMREHLARADSELDSYLADSYRPRPKPGARVAGITPTSRKRGTRAPAHIGR